MSQTATVRAYEPASSSHPLAAVRYGIRELARRAGVSDDFLRSWRIEKEENGAVCVYIQPGTRRRLRFPQARPAERRDLTSSRTITSVASWMFPPSRNAETVPDFRIPYSTSTRTHVGPLFVVINSEWVECAVDLPLSILLTLSRYEETLPGPRDVHGRFSARSSIAWRDGHLCRPIIDEYGLAFAQALSFLLPAWRPQTRHFQVKLDHDVDEIGFPFSFRTTLGHTLRRHKPLGTLRDLLAVASGIDNTYEKLFHELMDLSTQRGIRFVVNWKASAAGPHDTGYDPRHPKLRGLIESLKKRGIELGVHPGYETYQSPDRFFEEIRLLQSLLGENRLGGRQDHLRWNPQTWSLWEKCKLGYDGSVGYADQIGFRAGTCYPYRPWLLSENRPADIIEIPLLAMDATLEDYMQLSAEQALTRLRQLIQVCRMVGGVFSVLWHNTKIISRNYARMYKLLLDDLAGSDFLDGRTIGDEL